MLKQIPFYRFIFFFIMLYSNSTAKNHGRKENILGSELEFQVTTEDKDPQGSFRKIVDELSNCL
jgi:hypothetical protein